MLTIFSIPKPFRGHIGVIQRNALASWSLLQPKCEILLCGTEPELGEIAAEYGARWISHINCNQFGTPLLDSVFHEAARGASHGILCYVNADIILLNDFLPAVQRIPFSTFLMVGRRWDLDLDTLWNYADTNWEAQLRQLLERKGRKHPPLGSDYFVFPGRARIKELPSFAVGRAAWDNWMIFNARRLNVPVVDASRCTTVIHQNHDYAHVQRGDGKSYDGAESNANLAIVGNPDNAFTLHDATHVMHARGVRRALAPRHLLRRLELKCQRFRMRKQLLRRLGLRRVLNYIFEQ